MTAVLTAVTRFFDLPSHALFGGKTLDGDEAVEIRGQFLRHPIRGLAHVLVLAPDPQMEPERTGDGELKNFRDRLWGVDRFPVLFGIHVSNP